MSNTRAFIVPVVVDDAPEADESVPERFRDVQWTPLPGGVPPTEFVARVRALLSGAGSAAPPSAAGRPSTSPVIGARAPAAQKVSASRGPELVTRVSLAVLALTVAYFAFDSLSHRKPVAAIPPEAVVVAPPRPAINPHSIAVLPFTDMSEKKDQEYFSDGVAETLLDLLAKTRGSSCSRSIRCWTVCATTPASCR